MLNPEITAKLAELDALFAASTQGDWLCEPQLNYGVYSDDSTGSIIASLGEKGGFKYAPRPEAEQASNGTSIATLHNAYPTLRQHIAAQAARIAELEQGINSANTAAAHHYEKLTANNETYRAELSASQAQNAVPRDALEESCPEEPMIQDEQGGCVWCGGNPPCKPLNLPRKQDHSSRCGWIAGRAALSSSPAASLAMVRAGALREAASKLESKFGTIISCGDLLDMADQLESAAKGEKPDE